MSDELMPKDLVAEEPARAPLVTVTVIHPLCEEGRTYRPGAVLETTQTRAERLVELKLVAWPPPPAPARTPWWTRWIGRKPGNGRR